MKHPKSLASSGKLHKYNLTNRPWIAKLLPNQSALKNPSRRDLFCQSSELAGTSGEPGSIETRRKP